MYAIYILYLYNKYMYYLLYVCMYNTYQLVSLDDTYTYIHIHPLAYKAKKAERREPLENKYIYTDI